MESRGKVIVILGPTSSGKSNLAIKLARNFNGEIVSADSRQIYRGMDIGTGKITKREQRLAKHWMIDIASPKTEYNVTKFKKEAEKIITDILRRGKLPIVCGGTGFWIKTLVDNIEFPAVAPDKLLRDKLSNKTASELLVMLKKLDPIRAKNIDPNNKVRLIRAIEIAKTLGSVPKSKAESTKHNFLQIGIDLPKEKLHKNIQKRLLKRFHQGMIREVKKLRASGLSWKKIQSFGLGYYWIPLYLQGKLSQEEIFERIYQVEKDYAKRQLTWFNKDKRILWKNSYPAILKTVKSFLK